MIIYNPITKKINSNTLFEKIVTNNNTQHYLEHKSSTQSSITQKTQNKITKKKKK